MAFRIGIYSFTNKGKELASVIVKSISGENFREDILEAIALENTSDIERDFHIYDGLIFIGAVGIAVRKIAPYLMDKLQDPAVLVIDELRKNVIPVLSGHIGGANDLAVFVSDRIGANPVITTATDINGFTAIDVLASRNGMIISNSNGIKIINEKLLNGEKVTVYADDAVDFCNEFSEYELTGYDDNPDVIISSNKSDSEKCILHILNKKVVLGVGCRKNISPHDFEKAVLDTLTDNQLSVEDVCVMASIDIKAKEKALLEFSEKYGIRFVTYSPEDLGKEKGDFHESSFVFETTGVSNVSERAASRASGGGRCIMKRNVQNGVTVSLWETVRRIQSGNS